MWKKLLLALLLVAAMNPGCRCADYLLYSVAPSLPRETIKAETDALEGQSVAVVIYSTGQVHYEYPLARRRLAIRIADQLRKQVKDVRVVDPQRILRYQDENVQWDRLPRAELGRQFDADRVLFITLREYSLRERGSVNLFRGRIVAEAKIYDTAPCPDDGKLWQMSDLRVAHPTESRAGVRAYDERSVAKITEQIFTHRLVRKFYDHKAEPDESDQAPDGGPA